MHFLHINQLYNRASGASRYFIEIGERLVREGHKVTVLTSDAQDLEHFWARGKRTVAGREAEHGGVRVLRFPVRRAPGRSGRCSKTWCSTRPPKSWISTTRR